MVLQKTGRSPVCCERGTGSLSLGRRVLGMQVDAHGLVSASIVNAGYMMSRIVMRSAA